MRLTPLGGAPRSAELIPHEARRPYNSPKLTAVYISAFDSFTSIQSVLLNLLKTMSIPPPPPSNKSPASAVSPSKPRSPKLKPLTPTSEKPSRTNNDDDQVYQPVEPHVLAEAVSKLDMIRSAPAPMSTVTSPAASAAPSGPSSPRLSGAGQGAPSTGPWAMDRTASGDGRHSAPGTPHFGASTAL